MINREDTYWAWVWDLENDEKERALVIDSAEKSGWCVVVNEPERFLSGCEVYDTRNYINHYPIKKKRLMTREEILGFIAWNPHIVTRIDRGNALFSHGRSMLFDDLDAYEWAPITEAGEIGEWSKFYKEVEE